MKFKPLLNREKTAAKEEKYQKEDRNVTFRRLETQMVTLEKRYSAILERELAVARVNKKKNIKNSANYSKIGIAYYSLHILAMGRERLHEMRSSQELNTNIEELGAAIGIINRLNRKTEKMDASALIKGAQEMSVQSKGAGKDMVNVLSKLSRMSNDRTDEIPVDTLVSVELIEKLINGEVQADNLAGSGEGILHSPEETQDFFDSVLGGQNGEDKETGKIDLDSLSADIESLLHNLE